MKTKEILFEIRNATDDEELKCEVKYCFFY